MLSRGSDHSSSWSRPSETLLVAMVTVDAVAVVFTMETVVKGDSVEFSAVGGGNIAERSSLKNEI